MLYSSYYNVLNHLLLCIIEAKFDKCGVCSDGSTEKVYNADLDCASICHGKNVEDDCGLCLPKSGVRSKSWFIQF